MTKTAIHGTPVSPLRLLPQLRGHSFCVSFADPRDAERCVSLVGDDGILMLDNGAYSIWKGGGTIDVDAYCDWANDLMSRCPQARGVFPDVIGGSVAENLELLNDVVESGRLDPARSYVVWHMNEPLDVLAGYADRFPLIAFGSCEEFDVQTERAAFLERAKIALDVVRSGSANAKVHMMRGLGILQRHAIDFDSADSCNVARNHRRYKEQGGAYVRRFAERIEKEIEQKEAA